MKKRKKEEGIASLDLFVGKDKSTEVRERELR